VAARNPESALIALSKKGIPLDLDAFNGIVILDGNWKQSKSLWWRNPWLKKLPRVLLFPRGPSLYGSLRREPRRNSISTLEAASLVIETLEPKSPLPVQLNTLMKNFVERASHKSQPKFSVDTEKGVHVE
jgi:DTW domain-containing protein